MASKRSAPPAVHPSRQHQVPGEPRPKRRRFNDKPGRETSKKAHPVNEVKARIRSLRRLLERNDGLPANVRVEKERALQTAQWELDEAERAKERNDLISRYHKVRFFDRQKATRRLKRAKKELRDHPEADPRREELLKQVDDAQIELNYALYYPLDRHYVRLFSRKDKEGAGMDDQDDDRAEQDEEGTGTATPVAVPVVRQGDPEMWEQIKQSMADGTLEVLRNGKLLRPARPPEVDGRSTNKSKTGTSTESTTRQDVKVTTGKVSDQDEDSDGGFFE